MFAFIVRSISFIHNKNAWKWTLFDHSIELVTKKATQMKQTIATKKKMILFFRWFFFGFSRYMKINLLLLYAKSNHLTVVISIWLQTHSVNEHNNIQKRSIGLPFWAKQVHKHTLTTHSSVVVISHHAEACVICFKSKHFYSLSQCT